MNEDLMGHCPNCNAEMDGFDCYNCGYCSLELDDNEYETPEGNIAYCTEDEALENGYIYMCPHCGEKIITWWEMRDHGKCVTCWDVDNRQAQ